jgi:cellulose synthase/poly-beta-1,6-N-acetylglucosamine synthase-like glycosyltransferase
MRWVFWLAITLGFYTYLGYPLLLVVMASLRQVLSDVRFAMRRGERRRSRTPQHLPRVSLIFSAFNEEAVIASKMRNCAQLDYPSDLLEVLVGCDGCSDRTAAIARSAFVPGVRVLEFNERGGKGATLNRLVVEASGDVLVLCDANTLIEPNAIRALVRHFLNPEVGCVCGELQLRSPSGRQSTESAYWRYEVFLKFFESRLNMLVGVNGALYAMRRDLFEPVPRRGIIDDFLIAMNVRAKQHRIIYDPEAIAEEDAAIDLRHEFRRRVRIGAGNFHALRYTWRLLNPAQGLIALSYWSHKVCRWIMPFGLIAGLVSAALLSSEPFYAACAFAGAAFGCLAWKGYRLELGNRRKTLFSVPYYFLSMNLALALGLLNCLTGSQTLAWNPTTRTAGAEQSADEQQLAAKVGA